MNEWEFQLLEEKTEVESVRAGGAELKKGDRVRLNPRQGGDVFDLALAGKLASIESIEQDYEGKIHLAVILDDDPGRDLGVLRQPGHRFFFTPEEVQPATTPRILVAGIGNIFHGDDGFGVEVLQRMSAQEFPKNVRVEDFGIRGYDLAYALLDGYDTVILVDASARGDAPGTLYVIEPELNSDEETPALDAHAMNPLAVLSLAKTMGTVSSRILLVACEPETLGGEDGHLGLSDSVAAAVDGAIQLVRKLIDKENADKWNT